MTLQELITLAERRLASLAESRIAAERIGDVDAILRIDSATTQTQATLNALQSLPQG